MVQACHASLEAGSAFRQPQGPSCVALLAVTCERELLFWRDRLAEAGVRSVAFSEPDPILDGDSDPMGQTALATEPIGVADRRRKILRSLRLWEYS
jgi:hypothetical protein